MVSCKLFDVDSIAIENIIALFLFYTNKWGVAYYEGC